MSPCIYCGTPLDPGAFFCPKCLKVQLLFTTPDQQTMMVPPPPPPPIDPPPPMTPANQVVPPGARRCPKCNNIISGIAVACPLCGGRQ